MNPQYDRIDPPPMASRRHSVDLGMPHIETDEDSSESDMEIPLGSLANISKAVASRRNFLFERKERRIASNNQHFNSKHEDQVPERNESPSSAKRRCALRAMKSFKPTEGDLVDEDYGIILSDNSDADPDFEVDATRQESGSDSDITASLPLIEATGPSDNTDQNILNEIPNNTRGRKRRRMTGEERKLHDLEKFRRIKEKHSVLEGCGENCPKHCSVNFSTVYRRELNCWFWDQDWVSQRKYVRQTVTKTDCKVRRAPVTNDENCLPAKKCTYKYNFRTPEGLYKPVCKNFFLSTLGFKPNNDKIVRNAFNNMDVNGNNSNPPLEDHRGRHAPKHKINHAIVHKHVEKFNPCIPHYRREHAPLRRYLPSDLTLRFLHKDFCEQSGRNVCESFYAKAFSEMNISFTRLGHEECDLCHQFTLHKENNGKECAEKCITECKMYSTFIKHKRNYNDARHFYQLDTSLNNNRNAPIFSADLQKVILLPRMDQFKKNIFTSRLIVFNETFAPVGSDTPSRVKLHKDMAIIWHEAIAGRKDEDITSAFHKFLWFHRDATKITLWLDNCSCQNKNWTLFTMFLHAVDDEGFTNMEQITLKYFEPGHTFMSADSVHAKIENVLKRRDGKIFDFSDFEDCVTAAPCKAHTMRTTDFSDWESGVSRYLLTKAPSRPYLSDIVCAEFRRGFPDTLFFKNSFKDKDFLTCKILKQGFVCDPQHRTKARGITQEKKDEILKQLLPLMPHNRRTFWEQLPSNTKNKDLMIFHN